MPCLDAIPKTSVPYYASLWNYEWVDDLLESERLALQIAKLKRDISQIKKLPPIKDELLEALKKDFEGQRQRRIERFAKFIRSKPNDRPRRSFDGLKYDHLKDKFPLFFEWEEIVAAVESLGLEEGLPSEEERMEEIDRINGEIAKLEAKLIKCCPGGYHLLQNGEITNDSRRDFVKHWCAIQRKCNAPCGPTGRVLALSSEAEQQAYYRLEINKLVNRQTDRSPHPGVLCHTSTGLERR